METLIRPGMDRCGRFGGLCCPHCRRALEMQPLMEHEVFHARQRWPSASRVAGPGNILGCASGHRFDIAREGYVNLLPPAGGSGQIHGDSQAMVRARRTFLQQGFYSPLIEAICEMLVAVLPVDRPVTLLDAGCGEGYLLHSLCNSVAANRRVAGVCGFDLSTAAVRQAARLMPNASIFVANIRHPWPVASAWADLLINIFAPRNPGEFRRVVRPLGHLLVVIPAMDHLRELGTIVPLLPVAPNKEDTLRATLPDFGLLARREVAFEVKLPGPVADGLLAMTPNAWAVPLHARQKLRERSFIAARASFIGLLFRRTENP